MSEMADLRISVDQYQFICPICLDLLKEPVTVPCGHSYCMSCITGYWDQEDRMGIYSCPQCRKTFLPRPALGKNVMIAEMVEKLKKTEPRDAVLAGPGDVKCDVCTGRKNKAVKSCLVCLNSYCQTHFEEFHSDKRHKVIDATGRLKEMICQKHHKLLEVFCRTDKKCICVLCVMDEHRNHETVSAAEEKSKMQGKLWEMQRTFEQRIQQRKNELQEVRGIVESLKRSAQAAVEDSEKIFSDLILSIERSRSEVTQLIRAQERASVSRAEERLERLKQEIADLRRNKAELEQFTHTQADDHISFLQSFQSLSLAGSSKLPKIDISSAVSFDEVGKSVSKLRDQLIQYCREAIDNISVKHNQIILGPEYETREEYLRCFRQFTLDPKTTHSNFILSDGNKAITSNVQPYPDHPDRFDRWVQVLCRERVSGRCYWEVDWSQSKDACVSVSYKSIGRKGQADECRSGYDDQSWKLFCSPSRCLFTHGNKVTELPGVSSSRIGVYVDHGAGILSFYSVSDTMTLIHKVQTTFTQPLYPGILLGKHTNTVKLCHLRDSVKYILI